MRIAVFDVDHTITRASTGRRLIEYGRRSGLFSLWTLVTLPYHYVRYRIGTIRMDRVAARIAGLGGRTYDELSGVAARCYREAVRNDIMPEALAAVRFHQEQGDTVVLATSSIDLIIEPLARELGIEQWIATRLEFADGVATGRFAGLPCFSHEKLRRVTDLVSSLGTTLNDVVFYSDSRLDLPLLEAAAEAVAVNPDRGLRRVAEKNGWTVRRFR